jgi:hypothetical protein
MLTRFMDELELAPDGRSLEVCGPVSWEPGDVSAEIHFILRQGSVIVGGSAHATAPHDDEWEVEHVRVPGPTAFVEDQATGIAVAVVSREDGRVKPFNWSHEVELKKEEEGEGRKKRGSS